MLKTILVAVTLATLSTSQQYGARRQTGYKDRPVTNLGSVRQQFATSLRRPASNVYNPEFFNNRPNDFAYSTVQNLRSENVNHGDGNYNYFYENNDGTAASEKGYLKAPRSVDDGAGIQTAEGFYQYYSPEGQLIRVDYIADENGFQPRGDHLPTPPPIPEAIQKSLDLIYAGIERQKLNPYQDPYNYQENYNYKNNNRNRYNARPVYGPNSQFKRAY